MEDAAERYFRARGRALIAMPVAMLLVDKWGDALGDLGRWTDCLRAAAKFSLRYGGLHVPINYVDSELPLLRLGADLHKVRTCNWVVPPGPERAAEVQHGNRKTKPWLKAQLSWRDILRTTRFRGAMRGPGLDGTSCEEGAKRQSMARAPTRKTAGGHVRTIKVHGSEWTSPFFTTAITADCLILPMEPQRGVGQG